MNDDANAPARNDLRERSRELVSASRNLRMQIERVSAKIESLSKIDEALEARIHENDVVIVLRRKASAEPTISTEEFAKNGAIALRDLVRQALSAATAELEDLLK